MMIIASRFFYSALFFLLVFSSFFSCDQSINVNAETVDEPSFSPGAGPYNSSQTVSILHTDPEVIIRYTTNGDTPTAASPEYPGPFLVSTTTTVRAIATKPSYTPSAVVSRRYAIVWRQLPDLAASRIYFGAANVSGLIYLAGGDVNGPRSNTVVEYNPTDGTQVSRQSLPSAVDTNECVELGGALYSAGGLDATPAFLTRMIVKTSPAQATPDWAVCDDGNFIGRSIFAMVSYNGCIYAFGGSGSMTPPAVYLASLQKFDSGVWSALHDMNVGRSNFAGVVCNGKIYAIGGNGASGSGSYTSIEEYSPISNEWVAKANMPTGRSSHKAAVVNNKIYVFGGSTTTAISLSSVEEFDPAVGINGTWSTKTSMPIERTNFGIAVVSNKIYIMGGSSGGFSTLTVYEYDPLNDY